MAEQRTQLQEELRSSSIDCGQALKYLHTRLLELKRLIATGNDEYNGSVERVYNAIIRLAAYAKEYTSAPPEMYKSWFIGQPEHDEFVCHVEDCIETNGIDLEEVLAEAGEIDMKAYGKLYDIPGDKGAAAFVKIINDWLTGIDEEYEFFVGNFTPVKRHDDLRTSSPFDVASRHTGAARKNRVADAERDVHLRRTEAREAVGQFFDSATSELQDKIRTKLRFTKFETL